MSGMDRLTDEALDRIIAGGAWATEGEAVLMARELLAHRRASQAAPAPVAWRWRDDVHQAWNHINWEPKYMDYVFIEPLYAAPAPSDGLREENERLRAAVLRDAKRRMADLTEWLNEDDANPILLRHAVDAADLELLRAALSASPAQEGGRT